MPYKIKADYCARDWKEDSSSNRLKCYIVLQHIVMMYCITHALQQYRITCINSSVGLARTRR